MCHTALTSALEFVDALVPGVTVLSLCCCLKLDAQAEQMIKHLCDISGVRSPWNMGGLGCFDNAHLHCCLVIAHATSQGRSCALCLSLSKSRSLDLHQDPGDGQSAHPVERLCRSYAYFIRSAVQQ
eukprot:353272-Chlamydomonas_euryale.AAC.12